MSYELATPEEKPVTKIDMGVSKRLTTSDGKTVEKREIDRKKIIRLQRSVSRKVRGSNNWKKAVISLAREWQRVTDKERDYLHRLSAEMVKIYDFIAVEKLKTKNMLRNGNLARSISEQTWDKLITLLNEKAESAGIKMVEEPQRDLAGMLKLRGNSEERPVCTCSQMFMWIRGGQGRKCSDKYPSSWTHDCGRECTPHGRKDEREAG